jgi:hypothetical protein
LLLSLRLGGTAPAAGGARTSESWSAAETSRGSGRRTGCQTPAVEQPADGWAGVGGSRAEPRRRLAGPRAGVTGILSTRIFLARDSELASKAAQARQ